MQQTLDPRLETLLGKCLAGLASEEEAARLRHAASENEELRRALELADRAALSLRHSAIGETPMMDCSLPAYSRPKQLAETLEHLHAHQRRIRFLSLGVLVSVGVAAVLIGGPRTLWSPVTLASLIAGGTAMGAVAIRFQREDPVRRLSRLQALDGGEPWLEQVQSIERTRRRYASCRPLVIAAGLLLAGITADVAGTAYGSTLSENIGKFAFLASVFSSTLLWFRHRQYKKLPAIG